VQLATRSKPQILSVGNV